MTRSNSALTIFLGCSIVSLLLLKPPGDAESLLDYPEDQQWSERLLHRTKRHGEQGILSLQGSNLNSLTHTERAKLLKTLLTKPQTLCRKLVRVGGRTCRRFWDGSKLVCFDADVRPTLMGNCLTYSFGVGNDFTFDEAMQDYGCEVHSFDDDKSHHDYTRMQGPKVYFHTARIGTESKYYKYCEDLSNGTRLCKEAVLYQTMERTRRLLKHEDRPVDYFKMDIEGSEWATLLDAMANTSVLHVTKQIGLEIHLEDISDKALETQRAGVASYLEVLKQFEKLGFVLAKVDNNDLNPMLKTVDGVTFNIYAELLFIKRPNKVAPI